jgi:hypothetical protein
MHIENEAGPSRPKTPPTLPPRPASLNTGVSSQQTVESTTADGGDTGLNEDQMIVDAKGDELYYRTYRSEEADLAGVKRLIDQELSEPYVRIPPSSSLLRYLDTMLMMQLYRSAI